MKNDESLHEFLVLSRGQWDTDKTQAEIQAAIDAFYDWYERLVAEGRVARGHRLAREGKVVSRQRIADGPFAEAKEVLGGYALMQAGSKAEVVELCRQFLSVVGQGTCEVHQLYEMPAHQ